MQAYLPTPSDRISHTRRVNFISRKGADMIDGFIFGKLCRDDYVSEDAANPGNFLLPGIGSALVKPRTKEANTKDNKLKVLNCYLIGDVELVKKEDEEKDEASLGNIIEQNSVEKEKDTVTLFKAKVHQETTKSSSEEEEEEEEEKGGKSYGCFDRSRQTNRLLLPNHFKCRQFFRHANRVEQQRRDVFSRSERKKRRRPRTRRNENRENYHQYHPNAGAVWRDVFKRHEYYDERRIVRLITTASATPKTTARNERRRRLSASHHLFSLVLYSLLLLLLLYYLLLLLFLSFFKSSFFEGEEEKEQNASPISLTSPTRGSLGDRAGRVWRFSL